MAINPADITTVQVKELPPNALSLTNNFPHEVGDVLSRATIGELVNLVRSQSVASAQYELKILRVPNYGYITDNFDMSAGASMGLGKVGGIWETWAICNGNNGTDNLDGQTLIGFGANYSTVGSFTGDKEVTLTVNQIPAHNHLNGISNDNLNLFVYGGTTSGMPGSSTAQARDEAGAKIYQGYTNSVGTGQPHSNMQPSRVVLIIMKL